MIEQTLCIIKPDAALTTASQILIQLIADNFAIVRLQRATLTKAQGARLYEAHVGQAYYENNLDFMLSGPALVMVLEGEDGVMRLRAKVGPTDPTTARASPITRWTLRGIYGHELPRNAVHASASANDAAREIGIFFPSELPPTFDNMPWRK